MNRFSEKDWKIFRSKIAAWQEAYMEKLNKEYIDLLNGEGNASKKFWALEKRIKKDKKDCGVQCEMSRSNQLYIMRSLLNEGAITMDDLDDFSDDLKDTLKHFYGRWPYQTRLNRKRIDLMTYKRDEIKMRRNV